MTGVVLDDAVVALRVDVVLDGATDLVEVRSRRQGGDAVPEGLLGDLVQTTALGHHVGAVGVVQDEGACAVAVPPVELRATVDRDEVARRQDAGARDAVDDLVADRRAHRVAVAGNQHEVGFSPTVTDGGLGDGVELEGRHAGSHDGLDGIERRGRQESRRDQSSEFVGGLVDAGAAERHEVRKPRRRT
ncbi:hypothetical protein AEQ27_03620 [Frigoribacterium sp. RIT-PI-h]|nr:hypothetical protein AEQ27_03620 [Frigoribacterium sp. RIT-PI-h]